MTVGRQPLAGAVLEALVCANLSHSKFAIQPETPVAESYTNVYSTLQIPAMMLKLPGANRGELVC